MQRLNRTTAKTNRYPVNILQFGEGNFLRAFVEWMVQTMNRKVGTEMGIAVVQPLPTGMVDILKDQDGLYHLVLQGIANNKPIQTVELIDVISEMVNPYSDYSSYMELSLSKGLKYIISNTTEAGIARLDGEDIGATPPQSFPGKITNILYNRYKKFNGSTDSGLTIICCELIDKNATKLKEIVLELAQKADIEDDFFAWIESACNFCNTLVDRIVPGYPKDKAAEWEEKLSYKDSLIVEGEFFHLWAIEAPQKVREALPLKEAGLNVVWLDDMTSFREKKVRILNGSHTALVPIGLLSGFETVKEAFENPTINRFLNDMVEKEIEPTIEGDRDTLRQFSCEILERFKNPYIKHYLKDISLNSTSKWATRDLPSVEDYLESTKKIPQRLALSLAALLILYKQDSSTPIELKDSSYSLDKIRETWLEEIPLLDRVKVMLSDSTIWGKDLSLVGNLTEQVTDYIDSITEIGTLSTIEGITDSI